MQSYTELTPPTAVTHSLSVPFLSRTANNLIVVKSSLVQIFSPKSVITHIAGAAKDDTCTAGPNVLDSARLASSALPRGDRQQSTKLVLIAQYELSGTVTALARVKILRSRSGGEAVLLALRDAKLSLIEWDPERYSISTISIHSYEQEDIKRSPWETSLSQSLSYLSVDPSSRCAALKFGARHLAILPFYQDGDDLVMDDYDPDIDGDRPIVKAPDGPLQIDKAPYAPSFVLSLLALDPSLSHPIHLSFLFEYREPTFGILSSEVAPSNALLHERRDKLTYAVFTLDLEQRASTTLLSVSNLPYDLFAVVPLPLPVGGALLVGGNELIHVDQSGKTNGVAVNQLAKQSTAFAMLDQSDLALRLEGCVLEKLGGEGGEMVMILSNGQFAVLSFKTDGRSVSGLAVRLVTPPNSSEASLLPPSCTSVIGRGRMFVGSEDGDSVVLGWSRKVEKTRRQSSRANDEMDIGLNPSDLEEEDLDDDDDLYSSTKPENVPKKQLPVISDAENSEDFKFRTHDVLQNFGPISAVALGGSNEKRESSGQSSTFKELMTAVGCGQAGSLSIFQSEIEPNIAQRYNVQNACAIWSVCTKRNSSEIGGQASLKDIAHDEYLIANTHTDSGKRSSLYSINSTELKQINGTDFESEAGASIEIGTLNNGTRIIQVLSTEVKTFDCDFGLAQMFPLTDESTENEAKVTRASFADPYILLVRDDSSVVVLAADESGDLDEVESGEAMLATGWLSGSLYDDANDTFGLEADDDEDQEVGNVLLFLLSRAGGLYVYRLPNLSKPVYVAEGLSFLPPFLSKDFTVRRSTARENLKELLVADLGDSTHKSPYLILRSAYDDLIIYQPYQAPSEEGSNTALRFLKIPNLHLPALPQVEEDDEERSQTPLRILHDLDGYSTVVLAGQTPSFILKSASSPPQIISIRSGEVQSLCGFNVSNCQQGFAYLTRDGNIIAANLASNTQYYTGMVTRKIPMGEEIQALDYYARTMSYVIGTSRKTDYKLSEEELFGSEETTFLPQLEKGSIKLLDRQTWSIVDKLELDIGEVVTSIKTMSLETSEITHERQDLVVAGTALIRGEELPAIGRIYVFSIIDVVPEPDRPETGKKLKLIAKEEVKGAVTSLSEIGSQGFLLAAQGQKCMVRGLKEDGTLLPVAFMDMQCYVSAAKELKGTGMCVMSDAFKGIWFVGYTEDPYQLRLFGKSSKHIEAVTADFLPDGKQLYIIAADADCNIHVLQFDPENPKSLSGSHLLPLSSFHTGHFPTSLTLLPPSSSSSTQSLLLTTSSGVLALISPLPASSHRTLSALQTHLQSTLPHPCGLNPRVHRHIGGDDEGGAGWGARGGVVDGNVVRRWGEVGSWRRWSAGGDGRGEGEVRGFVRGLEGRVCF